MRDFRYPYLIDPITKEVMYMDRAVDRPVFVESLDPALTSGPVTPGTTRVLIEGGYSLENVCIDEEKRFYRIFKKRKGLSDRVAMLINENGSLSFGKILISVVGETYSPFFFYFEILLLSKNHLPSNC